MLLRWWSYQNVDGQSFRQRRCAASKRNGRLAGCRSCSPGERIAAGQKLLGWSMSSQTAGQIRRNGVVLIGCSSSAIKTLNSRCTLLLSAIRILLISVPASWQFHAPCRNCLCAVRRPPDTHRAA